MVMDEVGGAGVEVDDDVGGGVDRGTATGSGSCDAGMLGDKFWHIESRYADTR